MLALYWGVSNVETSKNFNIFLNSICNNIKYSPIRESVKSELYEHLLQRKEQYITYGLNDKDAEKKAIDDFGTPEEISANFNKIYKRKLDWKLLIIYVSLILINIFLTISVTVAKNLDFEYAIRNTFYLITGIIISFLLFFFNYQKLEKKHFTIRIRNYCNTLFNY